jgi:hypothetical protein
MALSVSQAENIGTGGVVGFLFGGVQGLAHGFQTQSLKAPGFSKELFQIARSSGRR